MPIECIQQWVMWNCALLSNFDYLHWKWDRRSISKPNKWIPPMKMATKAPPTTIRVLIFVSPPLTQFSLTHSHIYLYVYISISLSNFLVFALFSTLRACIPIWGCIFVYIGYVRLAFVFKHLCLLFDFIFIASSILIRLIVKMCTGWARKENKRNKA